MTHSLILYRIINKEALPLPAGLPYLFRIETVRALSPAVNKQFGKYKRKALFDFISNRAFNQVAIVSQDLHLQHAGKHLS